MIEPETCAAAVRAVTRRAPAALVLVAIAVFLCCAALLLVRFAQRSYDKHLTATVDGSQGQLSPSLMAPTAAHADELPKTGRFTSNITYTSIDSPGDGAVSSPVVWDDAWFFEDATIYNHELATTSSVLAALAYSESGYYQLTVDQPAYMEDALHELGFTEVSTDSYRYRSEIVDEVLNLVTGEVDTVAYTVARKQLRDADGAARSLLLVSVRGSYGSEWLSNFNFLAEDDHQGYVEAAAEIEAELASWITRCRVAGEEVSLLVVGHSRGGAIANLVAADADDACAGEGSGTAGAALAQLSGVQAYTFASPATTSSDTAHDARYGNIFNIVNPADIMPHLPLEAWGYVRYGVDRPLPSIDEDGFEERRAQMETLYRQTFGVEAEDDPADVQTAQRVVEEIAARVSTAKGLATPEGVVATVASCVSHMEPARMLRSHYPSTYIAWMMACA